MPFRDSQTRLLLQGIMAAASAPVCVVSKNLAFIAFNDEYREQFSEAYGVEPQVGMSLPEALAHLPDDHTRALAFWNRALEGDEFTITEAFGDPKHHRRIYELTYRGLRNPHGEQVGAVLFSRDLTEQIAAKEAQQESEHQFQELAEAMPQLVWTATADGTVDYYNRRREEYEGIESDTEGEWQWAPVLHPEDLPATTDVWSRAVRTGEPYEIEHRVKMKDGSFRWHLSRGTPAFDDDGQVRRWYGTATDIEATKRAELALRRADRRKDEFLAMLGHELRNPLAAIASGIRVIERGGEAARQALPMVQRHVDQMTRLLDDLLDVSRITRGQLRVERSVQPLAPIIAGAVAAVRPRVEEFRHTVEVPQVPELYVDVDAARLEQVVSNLLDNAVSYTPPDGKVSVWVTQEDDQIAIHVRDTGRGIRAEHREEIFKPFRQGESQRSRGLGIGLALVKRLVELHEGSIELESAGRGQGSEFIVKLPRAEAVQGLNDGAQPGRLDGMHILTVDDNVDAAHFLAILLGDAGANVEVAATGAEGLQKAQSDNFDVVLLDIGLPDMNGREVARRLRQMPEYLQTRLVAISGYGQSYDIAASLDAGIDAHLAKPVSPERLREVILDGTMVAPAVESGEAVDPGAASHGDETKDADGAANSHRWLPLMRQLVHDLRSPLSTIEFSGAILEHHAEADSPAADVAGRLSRTSASMNAILERALDMAAIEFGGVGVLDLESSSADDLAEAVARALDAEGALSTPPVVNGGPTTQGLWDRRRLGTAIARLTVHAEQAGRRDHRLEIEACDDRVAVEIAFDTAVPSPATTREHTDNYDSLDMDIRLTDGLVRAHGGSLEVAAREQHFVVSIELPATQDAPSE